MAEPTIPYASNAFDAKKPQIESSQQSSPLSPHSKDREHLREYDEPTTTRTNAQSATMEISAVDVPTSSGADETQTTPLSGPDTEADSNGSTTTYNLLPPDLACTAFEQIEAEIEWQRMLHQTGEVPRLVCCQASINKTDNIPVYRHPSDKTIMPRRWTSTVDQIRRLAERHVGHELNHGLIQLYRGGNDFISEHSDKTLDIVPGSTIVNISLGAERTMRLRSKRAGDASIARTTHRIRMPHNSLLSMTLETNAKYLHGINADKRPRVELSEAELAFGGQRISMTFRQIGTFSDGKLIWGQGAVGKTRDTAEEALYGDVEESDRLIKAFGVENQSSCIDWGAWYGAGSNVLHLK